MAREVSERTQKDAAINARPYGHSINENQNEKASSYKTKDSSSSLDVLLRIGRQVDMH